MTTYLLYAAAAAYLGILTSISPCPLATNIAAVSYIGRKVESPRRVIVAGLLYTLGRCLLYLGLAVLLATTALSIPAVSLFLQQYMHLVLGPIFLVLGMFLVGLVTFTGGGAMMSAGMQKRVDALGIWGALFVGFVLTPFGGDPSGRYFLPIASSSAHALRPSEVLWKRAASANNAASAA